MATTRITRTTRTGRTVRLSLKGAGAFLHGGGALQRSVERAVREGAGRIEIDAFGIRFLDAAALGELVACRNIANKAGVEFRLCGVIGKARELLRITGLDRALMRQPADEKIQGLNFRIA
jgi:anti-anti-sigma factor